TISTSVTSQPNLTRGSMLLDPSNTALTFLKTGTGAAGVLTAGTYALTFRSLAGNSSSPYNNVLDGFKDQSGGLSSASSVALDGNNDGVPGDSFATTFTVASTPSVILSLPDFARGPDSTRNVRVLNNAGNAVQTIT